MRSQFPGMVNFTQKSKVKKVVHVQTSSLNLFAGKEKFPGLTSEFRAQLDPYTGASSCYGWLTKDTCH